jgi:GTPase SAR1 family protein
LGKYRRKLIEDTTLLNGEAGTFDCINFEHYGILPDGEEASSRNRFYYADGIGLIYDSTSFVSSEILIIIGPLDSYDIQ